MRESSFIFAAATLMVVMVILTAAVVGTGR